MASTHDQSSFRGWSRYDEVMAKEEEEIFSFPSQMPSLRFSEFFEMDRCPYDESPILQDTSAFDSLSLMDMEMITNIEPNLCVSLDLLPTQTTLIQEDLLCGYESGFGAWNDHEMTAAFHGIQYDESPVLQDTSVFDALPLMDMEMITNTDPNLCVSLDLLPTQTNLIQEDWLCGYESGFGVQNVHEMTADFHGIQYDESPILQDSSAFDSLPLMDMKMIINTDPNLCVSLDQLPTQTTLIQDLLCGYESGFGAQNDHEMTSVAFHGIQNQTDPLLLLCGYKNYGDLNSRGDEGFLELERKGKRCRSEEKGHESRSKMLTREVISRYFYMPIALAARELNIGLTPLKKKCRELGIRRWPRRKLMSLQTVIDNVQELGKEEGEGEEEKVRDAIGILEHKRKLMEEFPDLQLEHKTKRLRQACFKAKYKKRKTKMIKGSGAGILHMVNLLGTTHASTDSACFRVDHDDDEEMKSLFSDCFSLTNIIF